MISDCGNKVCCIRPSSNRSSQRSPFFTGTTIENKTFAPTFPRLISKIPLKSQKRSFDISIRKCCDTDRQRETKYHESPGRHMKRRKIFRGNRPVDKRHRHMVEINSVADHPNVLDKPVPGDISDRPSPSKDAEKHNTERAAT